MARDWFDPFDSSVPPPNPSRRESPGRWDWERTFWILLIADKLSAHFRVQCNTSLMKKKITFMVKKDSQEASSKAAAQNPSSRYFWARMG